MRFNDAYARAKQEIYHDMPLFELRQAIDSLSLLADAGFPDLAPGDSPIYSALTFGGDAGYQNRGLCLDAQWGGTDNGTPVWVYDCEQPWYLDDSGRHLRTDVEHSDAQLWTYNRESGEIVNTRSGKCLDTSGVSLQFGTPLQIWDCVGNDGQRWSYDIHSGVIQNALNTVVDVKGGTNASETPVWAWERNETTAQSWVTPF